jgi:EpsI family protein
MPIDTSMNNISAKPLYQQVHIWLKIALLLYVFFLLYASTITSLVKQWTVRDDYSHGFLIPLIFLYLVWHKRSRLRYLPVDANIAGGIITVLTAGFVLLIGKAGSVIVVQELSMIFMLYGIVLLLFGTQYLSSLAVLISYLFLMVPGLIDPLLSIFHYPSQIFAAKVAAAMLHAVNVPVINDAIFLELPNIVLEVAEECSGVRYLISILAIALPLAYITQSTTKKRVILIGAALLIGIFVNPVRIALVGLWLYMGGDPPHGPSHIFQGLFVAQAGYIMLFVLALIMSRKNSQATPLSSDVKNNNKTGGFVAGKKFHAGLIILIILLLLLQAAVYFRSPVPVSLNNSLDNLPLGIGHWSGAELEKPESLFSLPGSDEKLHRIYRNTDGKELTLHINYFAYQNQEKEMITFRHQRLYNKTREINISGLSADNVKINKAVLEYETQSRVIYYWYYLKGRIVANRNWAKFMSAKDGLITGKTNGAIIMVSRITDNIESAEPPTMEEMQFVQDVMTALSGVVTVYGPKLVSY